MLVLPHLLKVTGTYGSPVAYMHLYLPQWSLDHRRHLCLPPGHHLLVSRTIYTAIFQSTLLFASRVPPSPPSGLHLRAPGSADVITQGSEPSPSCSHCSITVSQADSDSNHTISAVDVLCSAKFMELYSAHGEYLCTAEGVRIDGEIASDDKDDHGKLYCLQHSFDAPVETFKLKVICMY